MIKILKIVEVYHIGGTDRGTSQTEIGFKFQISGSSLTLKGIYIDEGNNAEYRSTFRMLTGQWWPGIYEDTEMIRQALDENNDKIYDNMMFALDYRRVRVTPLSFINVFEEEFSEEKDKKQDFDSCSTYTNTR